MWLSATGAVRVLCEDGRVLGTADDGSTWVVLGHARRAELIAYSGPGTGYAVARRLSCAHALLRTVDGGATWSTRHCFGDEAVAGLATGAAAWSP